jgi:predicted membrane metal-binding protein
MPCVLSCPILYVQQFELPHFLAIITVLPLSSIVVLTSNLVVIWPIVAHVYVNVRLWGFISTLVVEDGLSQHIRLVESI